MGKKLFNKLMMPLLAITFLVFGSFGTVAKADSFDVSAPGSLTVVPYSQSQINLSWQPSTVSVNASSSTSTLPSIDTYSVFRDSSQIATTTTTMYYDMGLMAGTSYSYSVMAKDAQGNMSPLSSAVSGMTWASSTPATTTPPSGTSTPANPWPWNPNSGDVMGWAAVPQTLFDHVWGNWSSATTSSSSVITYDAHGYPMWNGSYINCEGQIDNDPAHHTIDPNDTDPGHNVGKNCPGGAPKTPMAGNMNWSGGMNFDNSGMPFRVWVGSGDDAAYWVVVPINKQTLEQFLSKIK
ncbi:MAG: fibronectin type III domain-containing protein [Candidatus Doudnabacteria bacterium]|nr:fibronectin type III domain-containing protein [Candidatus Doudnabacteria bacterium]